MVNKKFHQISRYYLISIFAFLPKVFYHINRKMQAKNGHKNAKINNNSNNVP